MSRNIVVAPSGKPYPDLAAQPMRNCQRWNHNTGHQHGADLGCGPWSGKDPAGCEFGGQSGPGNASRVMQYYIYQKGFAEGQFGYASALSVILFIILAAVALFQLRILRAGESDLA